jgi:hypothetical protein
VHCLTGYTIGEVLGVMVGTALGWSNWPKIAALVLGWAGLAQITHLEPVDMGGIPKEASTGQRMLADQSCCEDHVSQ